MGEIPGVGALHAHHPGVPPELPVQLAIAHVHGVDLLGAVLQHTVGEAPGGGPDIGADLAGKGQRKGLHGLFQLQAAPADVGQGVSPHLDLCGVGHRRAGLVHPLTVHKHAAGHDNGLGLLAAFHMPLLHQQHVQSCFIAHAASPPHCPQHSGRPDRRLCITGPPYPGGQTGRPDFSASDSGAPSAPGPG